MNIVIICNECFLKAAETLIFSLGANTKELINVYLLFDKISKSKMKKFGNFISKKCHGSLKEIKVDASVFNGMPLHTHFTKETYFRLLMPQLLPKEVKKVLFLDVDMIVRKPITELYETKFDGNAIIACASKWDLGHRESKALSFSPEHTYFNAGVILYDLEKIRKDYGPDFLIQCMIDNKEKIHYLDQDVLNIAFDGDAGYVDWKIYDFQTIAGEKFDKSDLVRIKEKAAIIHYLGDVKPWDKKHPYKNPLKWEYYRYVIRKGNPVEIVQILLVCPVLILFNSMIGFVSRRLKSGE